MEIPRDYQQDRAWEREGKKRKGSDQGKTDGLTARSLLDENDNYWIQNMTTSKPISGYV